MGCGMACPARPRGTYGYWLGVMGMGTATNNNAQATPVQGNGPTVAQVQLGTALGLPGLPQVVAVALAQYVQGNATGRRGITVQGTYVASAVVAQALNGGNAVTPGHVAATYLALGATAPGWGKAGSYAQVQGFTPQHSAQYGANKHLAAPLLAHGNGTPQGAPTWQVPSAHGALVQGTARALHAAGVFANLHAAASRQLALHAGTTTPVVPCGCTKGKGKACGTGRKVGSGQFAPLPAPPALPAPVAKRPVVQGNSKRNTSKGGSK